jgi:uncharacterized protein
MSFALITGASKGIGLAIAREMASRNINLLLIARDQAALSIQAQELSRQYGIKAYYFPVDLSLEESPELIYNWCKDNNYEIQYLVNNAGYGLNGKFEDYPVSDHLQMMHVNMSAVVGLCHLFLPQLKQQTKGYILNIASSSAYQAVPYLALYGASKAFVVKFTRALRYELKKTPVSVTCISPGPTTTNFISRANIGPKAAKTAAKLEMKPEVVAKISVDSMFKEKTEVITGFVNKLQGFLVWLTPKKLVETMAARIYE